MIDRNPAFGQEFLDVAVGQWLNSNKGTKSLTRFFATFYDRRTFGNSAAPKIGACLVEQFIERPGSTLTDGVICKSNTLATSMPRRYDQLLRERDAVEQAYQEAVQVGSI